MGRKSAKIAAKKGAADKARAQVYTRALKDVFMAAKKGGPDPSTNFLLKIAIDRAKKFNVPKDNIEKAIKKSQGSDGVGYEDVNYEGYGPGGVAIFIETSTNNVTRTAANVRSYFNKCQGSLGVNGCLEFVFAHKSSFLVNAEGVNEDDFTLEMIDAGADDVELFEGEFEVIGAMESFGAIQDKIKEMNLTLEEASLVRIPLNMKKVEDEATQDLIFKLVDLLEEDDDVQKVYHNMEIDEEEEG